MNAAKFNRVIFLMEVLFLPSIQYQIIGSDREPKEKEYTEAGSEVNYPLDPTPLTLLPQLSYHLHQILRQLSPFILLDPFFPNEVRVKDVMKPLLDRRQILLIRRYEVKSLLDDLMDVALLGTDQENRSGRSEILEYLGRDPTRKIMGIVYDQKQGVRPLHFTDGFQVIDHPVRVTLSSSPNSFTCCMICGPTLPISRIWNRFLRSGCSSR